MGEIKVEGKAFRKVHCDIVEVSIDFIHAGRDFSDDAIKVMDQTEKFLGELKHKCGIEPRTVRITKDNTLNRGRDYHPIESKRGIEFTIPFDMELINEIRSLLIEGNYKAAIDMSYKYSGEDELMEELRKEAILDSKRKAEEYADFLGVQVVGLDSLSGERFRNFVPNRSEQAVRSSLEAPRFLLSKELSADYKEYNDNIYITWLVE